MKIEVNIKKQHFFVLSGLILLIGILVVVGAYNSGGSGGSPSNFGHSVDEIDWTKPISSGVLIGGNLQQGGAYGLLNLIDVDNTGPVLFLKGGRGIGGGSSLAEGDITWDNGENLDIGTWNPNGGGFHELMIIKGDDNTQSDPNSVNVGTNTGSANFNVYGITTLNSDLIVNGNSFLMGTKQVDDSNPTPYEVNYRRYYVEASRLGFSVPIDKTIINKLCKDEDGCTYTLGMRNYDSNRGRSTVSHGPHKLFLSLDSNWWETSCYDSSRCQNEGIDGNGNSQNIERELDCFFTDGEFTNGDASPDSDIIGLSLLHLQIEYRASSYCILIIDD